MIINKSDLNEIETYTKQSLTEMGDDLVRRKGGLGVLERSRKAKEKWEERMKKFYNNKKQKLLKNTTEDGGGEEESAKNNIEKQLKRYSDEMGDGQYHPEYHRHHHGPG